MPNSATVRNPQIKLLDAVSADESFTEGAPTATAAPAANPRRRLFVMLAATVFVVGLFTLLWFWITADEVTTDNAYVDADVALVTPLYGGPVAAAYVSNTDVVKKGQVLVLLDSADAKLALEQAQAQLGQVQRKVRGYYANDAALGGQVSSRDADIARANAQLASAAADFERARVELTRRQALSESGAVSGDELTQSQNAFSTAKAALEGAKAARAQAAAQKTAAIGERSINSALIDGTSLDSNPEVASARAKLAQAELNLARTRITAPIDGVVVKNAVQVGQQVQPGQTLMTVVPIQAGPASQNTFSLIPAQNATGNWIKVVQRLPVRIALDPAELQAHPLRVGLSMNADIDVSRR